MGKGKTFLRLLRKEPGKIFGVAVARLTETGLLDILPDKAFLKLRYRAAMGKKLRLKNPETFNEKLQWLKLYDRDPRYTVLVDKYACREEIAGIIGKQYLIPLLGVWDRAEDMDFDRLPEQFVLKCNHDSASVVICRDKETFDKEAARKKLTGKLKRNLFRWGREWPYKNVKPRIICEKYLSDSGNPPADYKIHCFGGQPKFILVCADRFSDGGLTEDFYTPQWERMEVKRPHLPNAAQPQTQPPELPEMLRLAAKLAENIPFVRVDFYVVEGHIYFSEMTFFPACGFTAFEPDGYDRLFGQWLPLPEEKKE